MALGDIILLENSGSNGARGARLYNVASGTPILAGEPVQATLAGVAVTPAITSWPVVGTTYCAGIAATNSTNTATAAGTVYVLPMTSQQTWLVAPATATSWDTQAEYDALVGKRVVLQNSVTVSATAQNIGTYSILASDSSTNGCIVQALDISRYPGKVAFAFRDGANVLT